MPSLHIAWAVWCTVVVWRIFHARWVRALAALYPFVTGFAVLSTGNHYVLDILGGLATIAASLLIVRAPARQIRWPDAGALRKSSLSQRPILRTACHKLVTKSETR